MASPIGRILRTATRTRASSFFSDLVHGQVAAVSLPSRSRWIHSSSPCLQPRKPKNAHGGGIRDRSHFGNYSRLAPLSLKLGVTPPDVDSLVPPHILRPSYAARGEPSEWASGIPINTPETIQKARKAGQLAKKILELGGTLVKVKLKTRTTTRRERRKNQVPDQRLFFLKNFQQVGVSTDEIDRILHEAIIANGAYPSPLNYMGFPKSVCTSVSNVIAHGIPDR